MSGDMLRRSDQFQVHGLIRTFNNAKPAAHTFFIENEGFHLLGIRHFSHLDSFEMTPINAGLAALAFLFIDDCLEPAWLQNVMKHSQVYGRLYHHAAARTAIAEPCHTKIYLIPGLMQKPSFGRIIH